MKLAFIAPTAYLSRHSAQGDIYLALAHLVDDEGENDYAAFHRRKAEQGQRVILDNGLFEGAQVDTEALLRRAAAIGAQVVCAPDVLYDSKGTIKEFKRFIKAKQEFGLVCDVMGIPQADNPTDWWECYQFMELHSDCHLIGLSILSIPKSFAALGGAGITAARMYLIRQLYAYSDISQRRLKPMHLLGLGESYDDIKLARALLGRDVVSNDSSSAFVHGAKGIRYTTYGDIPGGKCLEKLDFDLRPFEGYKSYKGWIMNDRLKVKLYNDIQHNINMAKEIAHGPIDWSIADDSD